MIAGSESEEDTTGSTKDPPPAQDTPSQDAPVDDSKSAKVKVAPASSPTKNLTLDEEARSPWLSPLRIWPTESYHNLFDSDEADEDGAITELQKISNDLDEQQERYQAAQLQGASEVSSFAPPTPVYPRGYYPPDAGSGSPLILEHLKAPRGLNHWRASRGAYERALIQDKPLFVNDIEAARRFPVWGYPWVQVENTTTQTQADDLFWRWVSLKNFTVQELKDFREDYLLSYVLDQPDLRIEFAHLIAKR
ncbi:ABC Superfamily [Phytophthora palmivora]|uniref:ABC Superfamily n=1 Tax=Phytophthora palmivora TaxID=4796 RepID=A0A2P4YML7_9STRA|nr:ABC Superfamily [Phytophthora palmivora]